MGAFAIILVLSMICYLIAAFQFIQFWRDFRKIKVGEKLPKAMALAYRKKIKIAFTFFIGGSLLQIAGLVIANM